VCGCLLNPDASAATVLFTSPFNRQRKASLVLGGCLEALHWRLSHCGAWSASKTHRPPSLKPSHLC